jgi:NTE family protein
MRGTVRSTGREALVLRERALVLGGGGVTGIAWELGVLAGLADAGLDLGDADVMIGTSAGSVVAAQIASGTSLEELYEHQLVPPDGEIAAHIGGAVGLTIVGSVLSSRDVRSARRRIGRMALAADTVPEAERRGVFESRLTSREWPRDRRLMVTAVDAETGEFSVFSNDSGVPLVDAVAASCAVPGVWPPVSINGRRWIDGGVRTSANADLAHDYRRVVILAPIAMGNPLMPGPNQQAAQLVRYGALSTVVAPNHKSRKAIGRNPLDPAMRASAARAGRQQAPAVAASVRDVWTAA